jgi:hypothetical protein
MVYQCQLELSHIVCNMIHLLWCNCALFGLTVRYIVTGNKLTSECAHSIRWHTENRVNGLWHHKLIGLCRPQASELPLSLNTCVQKIDDKCCHQQILFECTERMDKGINMCSVSPIWQLPVVEQHSPPLAPKIHKTLVTLSPLWMLNETEKSDSAALFTWCSRSHSSYILVDCDVCETKLQPHNWQWKHAHRKQMELQCFDSCQTGV